MRVPYILLVAVAACQTGCATTLARAGRHPGGYKDREQVHAAFGSPDAVEPADDGSWETFTTHRKFAADDVRDIKYLYAALPTLWLSELVAVPYELCVTGREMIVGLQLRFRYDTAGRVLGYALDGHRSWRDAGASAADRPRDDALAARDTSEATGRPQTSTPAPPP